MRALEGLSEPRFAPPAERHQSRPRPGRRQIPRHWGAATGMCESRRDRISDGPRRRSPDGMPCSSGVEAKLGASAVQKGACHGPARFRQLAKNWMRSADWLWRSLS